MELKSLLKLFVFLFLVVFSLPCFSEDEIINSLSQIAIEKPIDNSYLLNLYFKDTFQGSAFLQKRKNGSFYVYIPNTQLSSKKIKIIYKSKLKQKDVNINIDEHPYIKEGGQSRYVRLSVETPVNFDIQLSSQKFIPSTKNNTGLIIFLYSLLIIGLLIISGFLSVSIFRALKSLKRNSNSYTVLKNAFSSNIQSKSTDLDKEKPVKIDVDAKIISPISTSDFSCFDLPEKKDKTDDDFGSYSISETTNPVNEIRIIKSRATNPIKKQYVDILEEESELDLPDADEIVEEIEETSTEENCRPELVCEYKIGSNKGFYLTTVSDNALALFGYIGEKIFFLQRFTDLAQVNLQVRFYDTKDGNNLYIVKLHSYKAMISVSENEIKELAVI